MVVRAGPDEVETVNALIGRDFPGVDFSEVLAEPQHICLVEGESGAIFMWRGPWTYELHVFFAAKGKAALDLGHRMLDFVRENYGGRRFWAAVPPESRNVIMFTRLMGWKHLGRIEMRHGPQELFLLED